MTFTTVECVQELSGAVSERKLLGIFKLKQNENTSMLTWPNNVYLGPALVEVSLPTVLTRSINLISVASRTDISSSK